MEAARAASPQMWGPEKVAESPRSLLASQGPRGPLGSNWLCSGLPKKMQPCLPLIRPQQCLGYKQAVLMPPHSPESQGASE